MKKTSLYICAAFFAFSVTAYAQPRPVDRNPAPAVVAAPAPASFAAKYEGGLFGFSEKQSGTLRFDDENERLVFFGKDGKEKFSIAYKAMLVVSPQSRSVRSTTGTVVSAIPLPGAGLAGLIRSKRRYMLVNFSDSDADVRGLANFKLDNKEILASVLQTLGQKAKLTRRGDAYYRPRGAATTDL
ncbi:MAG TPA: hypothetical protein VNI84_07800 [Pyrinomonadaceae bacterium]|nr:hypothetical protein [Pyrinomonadaceae bacterium]